MSTVSDIPTVLNYQINNTHLCDKIIHRFFMKGFIKFHTFLNVSTFHVLFDFNETIRNYLNLIYDV